MADTGGFVGVDVFFVISGYLISQLLLGELNRTGTIDLVAFYGRRARRLLPAALLVTVATLIVGYFVLSPLEQKEIAKSAAASSVFATNLFLLSQALNYFSPESSLNPFLHTWSPRLCPTIASSESVGTRWNSVGTRWNIAPLLRTRSPSPTDISTS